MDYKKLPLGLEDFEKLITRGYYYIDKTMFLKELIDERAEVSLFTRPRRFGKTLNMSMIRYFFEDARDRNGNSQDHSHLFEGLQIMRQGEQYREQMGQYPVISLTLKSAKQPDFEMSYQVLRAVIADEYIRHCYLCKSETMLPVEKEKYIRLMEQKGEAGEYANALQFLSKCLENYYGKKAVILIDEYDVPLENAFVRGFYGQMTDFVRSLFESALKTNSSLEFAVMTGCLRISRESIFTGMNNLAIFSILSSRFSSYFGFTGEEVQRLCEDYGMPQKYGLMKEWYNGYVFGGANVYNPWSVLSFLYELRGNINSFPSAYWANTSSNSIVRKMIDMADENTKQEIESLIAGKTLQKPVHEDAAYREVYESMEHLWSFLFFTGYLRNAGEYMDGSGKLFLELAIPNKEVGLIFRRKILEWFEEKAGAKDRTRLFQAFIQGNAAVLEEEIGDMLLETISFYDAYESFYHGFLAGIFSGMKGYTVKSNREGGRGRSDLFVAPVTRRKAAFVVEFKIAGRIRDMEAKAQEALRQIREQNYAAELESDGFETVHKYGIAFVGKDCHVEWEA